MFIEIPALWIALLNAVGIPVLHFGISWLFSMFPARWFTPDHLLASPLPGETAGFYQRVFQVKAWKKLIPDAAPWFGGFAKSEMRGLDPDFLHRFATETFRGEAAHWAQWIAISACVIWTPMPWAWVILIYAPVSNLPCMILQRQNRLRIMTLLRRGDRSKGKFSSET